MSKKGVPYKQCVCKIWQFLEIPQNLASHHLKILKDFGLLIARKEGQNVYYAINQKALKNYSGLLVNILGKENRED